MTYATQPASAFDLPIDIDERFNSLLIFLDSFVILQLGRGFFMLLVHCYQLLNGAPGCAHPSRFPVNFPIYIK